MNIQMRHIGVFRLLLTLVGLMDQDVEAIGRGIPCQHALKLLFVQSHQFLNRLSKRFEKLPRDIAIRPCPARYPKKLRFGLR